MKASEYVYKLTELLKAHGDLECVDADDSPMSDPEFSDDGGEPAFVLASQA